MNRKDWMRGEIAAWRAEGVIGEELADELSRRYLAAPARLSWGAIIAGVFGALLVGLGIIALLAANWDCFGRGARAVIALAPVVGSGALAAVAVRKGWRAMSFWEPLGVFWCLATGAATCLIAQTYQLGGSVPSLVLLVALLMLPIVWLTRTVVVTALWPIWAIAWGLSVRECGEGVVGALVRAVALLALSVPAFVAFERREVPRVARVMGELVSGLVYAIGTSLLIIELMRIWSFEFGVSVFWCCALVIWTLGVCCGIRSWPTAAMLVAFGAALYTPFGSLWLYGAAILLAGAITVYGVRKVDLGSTNLGAMLLLWLVLAKFFASGVDFTTKGLVLIGAGVALTVLNVVMIRIRKRSVGDEK